MSQSSPVLLIPSNLLLSKLLEGGKGGQALSVAKTGGSLRTENIRTNLRDLKLIFCKT